MAKDPSNTLKTAKPIVIASASRTLKESIGGKDKYDFYRFKLTSRSSFSTTLSELKADANLAILNKGGGVLLQSSNPQKNDEVINTSLDAGTYWIRVSSASRRKSTRYRLTLSTANTAPVLAVNMSTATTKGAPFTITPAQLNATDTHQSPQDLVYTLTALPENGTLKLNGTPLAIGSKFTQADIDSNRLSYTSFDKAVKLTNNTTDDVSPVIDGLNVAWAGSDGTDTEIFLYNGTTGSTVQLTNNNLQETIAGISGSNVIWNVLNNSISPPSAQAFFYNSSTNKTNQLVKSSGIPSLLDIKFDFFAGISGSKALLISWVGTDTEVFLYDSTTGTSTQLTNNDTFELLAAISGDNVVWNTFTSAGQADEVFFYSSSTGTKQLTKNNQIDQIAAISGLNVVWNGFDGNDYEVFSYNGGTGITTQLTNNNTNDNVMGISGANIIWNGFDGQDSEIFFYNGTTKTTVQLTNNTTDDSAVGISGFNIVWNGFVGTDSEVFFYNGTTGTTVQLTDNTTQDLASSLSGFNVVWTNSAEGSDSEVFIGNAASSDRFNFTVEDSLGGSSSGTFNFSLI